MDCAFSSALFCGNICHFIYTILLILQSFRCLLCSMKFFFVVFVCVCVCYACCHKCHWPLAFKYLNASNMLSIPSAGILFCQVPLFVHHHLHTYICTYVYVCVKDNIANTCLGCRHWHAQINISLKWFHSFCLFLLYLCVKQSLLCCCDPRKFE